MRVAITSLLNFTRNVYRRRLDGTVFRTSFRRKSDNVVQGQRVKYIKTELSTDIRSALDKAEQALKWADQFKRENELLKNEFEIFKQSFKSVKKDCSSLQQQVCSTELHSRRKKIFLSSNCPTVDCETIIFTNFQHDGYF